MFDLDILPGDDLEKNHVFDQQQFSTFYLDHLSQQHKASPKSNPFTISAKGIGNDALACSKGSPLMKKIANAASNSYTIETSSPNYIEKAIDLAYNSRSIKTRTIYSTGPGLLRNQLPTTSKFLDYDKNTIQMITENPEVRIKPLRYCELNETIQLCHPFESNTFNWLKISTKKMQSEKSAIETIIKTVEFELQHFKILRLEDHITDLLTSTRHLNTDPNAIINRLITKIENRDFDFSTLIVAQCKFVHQACEKFYISHNLDCKTLLNQNHLYFEKTVKYASGYDLIVNNGFVSVLKNETYLNYFSLSQLIELSIQLSEGLDFINTFLEKHVEQKYTGNMFTAINYIESCIKHYGIIAPIINSMIKNQYDNNCTDLINETKITIANELVSKIKPALNKLKNTGPEELFNLTI